MRYTIREDIINNAINESINSFLIEEGFTDNLKGFAGLASSGLGKLAKEAWNGLKMYMDYKTNGQWNQKYGYYVNANSKSGELFYFNKWLNYYKNELNSILYKASSPDNPSYDEEYTDEKGNKFKKRKAYNYSGPKGALEYGKQYCTLWNFNDYIRNISPDRKSVIYINNYIANYITKPLNIGDLNTAIKNLNIYEFYSSPYGTDYLKMNRQNQQNNAFNNSSVSDKYYQAKARRDQYRQRNANNNINNN